MNTNHPRAGKSQPRYEVLEEIARIKDSEVDGDQQIQEQLAQLEQAKAEWHTAIQAFDKVRFILEGLPAAISAVNAEIESIDNQRPEAVAKSILGDGNFSADDALLEQRAALALRKERLTMAGHAIDGVMRQKNAVVAQAARPVQSIEDDLANRRKALKLTLAERRCS
jgi:hypothetical protein